MTDDERLGDAVLRPVGWVDSPLRAPTRVPRQGDEGAPDAWVVILPAYRAAVEGLAVGDEVVLVTWLHRADRDVLVVHPRGDIGRPRQGVFSTRSPHRPNPIGLHPVEILAIDDADPTRVRVAGLDAVHGTPVLDIKAALGPIDRR